MKDLDLKLPLSRVSHIKIHRSIQTSAGIFEIQGVWDENNWGPKAGRWGEIDFE